MPRHQFSIRTLLWLTLVAALASAEAPRLWRALFPPQKLIEFTFVTTLDDGSLARYDLYEDRTYTKKLSPAGETNDGPVPPAARQKALPPRDHSTVAPAPH